MIRQYGYACYLGPSKFVKSLGLRSVCLDHQTFEQKSNSYKFLHLHTKHTLLHDILFWPKSTFGLCSAPTLPIWCDSCEALAQRKTFMKGSTTSRHRGTVLAHMVSQLVTYKFLVVFVFRLRAMNAVPVSF